MSRDLWQGKDNARMLLPIYSREEKQRLVLSCLINRSKGIGSIWPVTGGHSKMSTNGTATRILLHDIEGDTRPSH